MSFLRLTMFTIFNFLASSLLIICANAFFDLDLLEEKHAVVFEKRPLKKTDLSFGQDEHFIDEILKREQLMLSNKFGRDFVCFLPAKEEPVEAESVENSEDIVERPYSDVMRLLNPLDAKPLDQTLFPRKDCYYYTNQNEWWGYEVCPRQEIIQFHLSAKTAGQEQISSLGKYFSDFDWELEEDDSIENPGNNENSKSDDLESEIDPQSFKNLMLKKSPKSQASKLFEKFSSLKTHVQYYTDGKICDITGKPRTTEVWWKCHGSGGTRLVRIEEPTTCNYVIHMHTSLMCSHEKFESDVGNGKNEKMPVLETICYKAVSDNEFGVYQAEQALIAQRKLEEEEKKNQILNKFELDAEKAMGKSVDNVMSDISMEHLDLTSGTGEITNFQELKSSLTDVFSKLVKKELEKLDDDASQSAELESLESKIKTNYDKPISEKFEIEEDSVPDQLRELKKEVVENLKQAGQLQEGQEMQEIKIKIMNVDENGRLVEEDANGFNAPKFSSQQLKQIKQALMGAIVKETPENGKKAQNGYQLDSEIYNDHSNEDQIVDFEETTEFDHEEETTPFNHDEL